MLEKLTSQRRILLIATALLSGCSATSGLFKSSEAKLAETCNPSSREASILKFNRDPQGFINTYNSMPAECKSAEAAKVLYHSYDYDLAMAYYDVDNKKEALKYFELILADKTAPGFMKQQAKLYQELILSYSDPVNAEEHIHNAQAIYSTYRVKDKYLTFALNTAKYDHGERSPALLKSWLENLETPMDPYTPDPDQYARPERLARELGQTDIADTLAKRQQDLLAIRNKARAQNIPGYGTASGNAQLLIVRDTFYLNEYSRLGMKEQADYYQEDLQKNQDQAVASAQQSAIDAADAAAAENESRQYNQQMIAGLAGLASLIATDYATSHARAASPAPTHSAPEVVTSPAVSTAPAAAGLASSLAAVATGSGSSSISDTPSTPAAGTPTGKKSPFKPYEIASHCVVRDTKSNSLADFWVNSCSYSVRVMWFEGQDCQAGCMTGVSANGREATNKLAKGDTYRVAACAKPGTPFDPMEDKVWKGSTDFRCMN